MSRETPLLALVIPCYYEEEAIERTQDVLGDLLARLKAEGIVDEASFALYVDDGSKDGTWSKIMARNERDPFCRGVKFAANAGHQNALLAGMATAESLEVDCIISLDADLQDDPIIIPEMLAKFKEGCEIVYGARNDRGTDSVFKKHTAQYFYKVMKNLLGVNMVFDHADYRLVSGTALRALRDFGETSVFLRGIFPSMGFKTAVVKYKRHARQAGETKYPLRKLLSFAWNGITSFSAAPLRLAVLLSMAAFAVAVLVGMKAFFDYLSGEVITGWTSLIIVILFMSSAQLLCIGVIGEYLAKVFLEVKHRPRYIIEKIL